jgi:hypothetical protein
LPVLSHRGLKRDKETESLFLYFLEDYRMEYFIRVTHNRRATLGNFTNSAESLSAVVFKQEVKE